MAQRIELVFEQWDYQSGLARVDPSALSILTRPDGGGATIESNANLIDGSHKKETGVFFYTPTEDGGSYSESTWYEIVVTATLPNGTITSKARPFFFETTGTASSNLTAPVITKVVNDGDGDAITVTVTAASGQASDPIRILYVVQGGTAFSSGGTRTGDGDVNVTGLDDLTAYDIVAQHEFATDANVRSRPSARVGVVVHDGTRLADTVVTGIVAALRGNANLAAFALDGNWAKSDSRRHVFPKIEEGWVGGRGPGRAPFIEVQWDGGPFPERRTGIHMGLDYDMPLRIRCTVGPKDDIDDFVSDARRALQTDGNKFFGDSAHVVATTFTTGALEESLMMRRREIGVSVAMVATPGVNG